MPDNAVNSSTGISVDGLRSLFPLPVTRRLAATPVFFFYHNLIKDFLSYSIFICASQACGELDKWEGYFVAIHGLSPGASLD